MTNKLKTIFLQKKLEVEVLLQKIKHDPSHPIGKLLQGELQLKRPPNFKEVLKSSTLAVIAEIKRKSPSKGLIAPILDPIELAERYCLGGANALSILTDQNFFGGSIDDLSQVANALSTQSLPIIRKDFIIDRVQIAEAALAGASAILCIVTLLGEKVKALIEFAHSLNLSVLVEIHDEKELKIAVDCGADIIGINNRNLNTFNVDTTRALQIVSQIPDTIIKVAESGITHPALAREYYQAGFNAVLIGEALVKSPDPAQFISECRNG